jgi:hypothetical protein
MCACRQTDKKVGVLMFLVYGDESLDEKGTRVCAVAGLVGKEESWITLESKWKGLHGSIPFHANDCDSDRGSFALRPGENEDISHRKNKDLYKQSVMLLAESNIGGFAAVYDLKAQRAAFPPPKSPPLYYQPFIDVLDAMRGFAINASDCVKFTFDTRLESNFNAALIFAHLRESHPNWANYVDSELSFETSSKNSRIQIADLFARESMKVLDNDIGPVKRPIRKSWEALRNTRRFAVFSYSTEYFARPKMDIPDLESTLGFGMKDFGEWIAKTGRTWNVTSYFEFMMENLNSMSQERKQEIDAKLHGI